MSDEIIHDNTIFYQYNISYGYFPWEIYSVFYVLSPCSDMGRAQLENMFSHTPIMF